jgi:hypothetical protein
MLDIDQMLCIEQLPSYNTGGGTGEAIGKFVLLLDREQKAKFVG